MNSPTVLPSEATAVTWSAANTSVPHKLAVGSNKQLALDTTGDVTRSEVVTIPIVSEVTELTLDLLLSAEVLLLLASLDLRDLFVDRMLSAPDESLDLLWTLPIRKCFGDFDLVDDVIFLEDVGDNETGLHIRSPRKSRKDDLGVADGDRLEEGDLLCCL